MLLTEKFSQNFLNKAFLILFIKMTLNLEERIDGQNTKFNNHYVK